MNVRYRVELGQTERAELTALLSGGRHVARKLKRAQILLAADAGASDAEIARSVGGGVHRLSHQTTFCPWQPGGGSQRGAAAWAERKPPARKKLCWWQPLAQ